MRQSASWCRQHHLALFQLSGHVLFMRDARSALQKIAATMPERALQEARDG